MRIDIYGDRNLQTVSMVEHIKSILYNNLDELIPGVARVKVRLSNLSGTSKSFNKECFIEAEDISGTIRISRRSNNLYLSTQIVSERLAEIISRRRERRRSSQYTSFRDCLSLDSEVAA